MNLNENISSELAENILLSDRVFNPTTEMIMFLLYITFSTIGFLANFFIIILFLTKKIIREPQSLLFFNLAISDTVYCLFFSPFTLHNILRKSWPFGQVLCKIVPSFQGILIFVSSGTVTMISIQRTIIITGPIHLSLMKWFNKECFLVLQIWIFALLLSSPIFIFQSFRVIGIHGLVSLTICSETWSSHGRSYYTLLILIVQWVLPVVTMVICHYRVDSFLKRNNQLRVKLLCVSGMGEKIRNTVFCDNLVAHVLNKREIKEKLRRNTKVTHIMLRNTVIFGLIWLPLNLTNLYLDFYPDNSLSTDAIYLSLAISQLIVVFSPTSNAYLYYWSNTNIRKEVRSFHTNARSKNSGCCQFSCCRV